MRSRYGSKTGRNKRNAKKRSYKRKSYASTYNRFKRRMGYNRAEFPVFGRMIGPQPLMGPRIPSDYLPSGSIHVGGDNYMVPVDDESIEKYSGQKQPNPNYGRSSPQKRHRLDFE